MLELKKICVWLQVEMIKLSPEGSQIMEFHMGLTFIMPSQEQYLFSCRAITVMYYLELQRSYMKYS